MMKCLLFSLTCLLFFANAFCQQPDKIYMNNIHTPMLFVAGNQFGYPIIKLGSTASLELHFDDLEGRVKNYSYTYQLCNADWTPVDLSPFDYIDGFSQNRITIYRASSVATTKYMHYQMLLPEKNCQPKKTGNYLLKVFLNGDTSKLAFTKRLLVKGEDIPITAQILQPYSPELFKTHQKVQFSIDKTQLNVLNPSQQLKVVVLQNYRWDNAVTGAQPAFMRQNVYEYNGEKDFVFPAGKDFRWVNLKSFRYLSDRVKSADREVTPFDVVVAPDGERTSQRFIPYTDLNGFYEISSTDLINPWWQGDYANVHFMYVPPNNQPYAGKDIYIMGQLTNYLYNDSTRMEYNANLGIYEKNLLLKQGYYTYSFATKDAGVKRSIPTAEITDGNYWETENDYTILVYYRSFSERSDALVGVYTINSRASRVGF